MVIDSHNHISFIQTEEGRVFPYSTDTSNYYQYFLADHLGNTRVAFDTPHDTLKVEQQDDYLPFGMEISQGLCCKSKK